MAIEKSRKYIDEWSTDVQVLVLAMQTSFIGTEIAKQRVYVTGELYA